MKKGNILVVEDQKYVRALLVDALSFFGYSPLEAKTPYEALQMLRKNRVDLSIVDYCLPEMDGLELIEEIRKINPKIPIFITSGFSDIVSKRVEKSAKSLGGIIHFLEKPIDLDNLKNCLDKVISCAV